MVLSDYLQRFDKAQLQQLTQGLGVPLVLLAIMGMVILPMPPLLLDVLFSFNIALSLVIILVAVFTQRPVDFGIFPLVLSNHEFFASFVSDVAGVELGRKLAGAKADGLYFPYGRANTTGDWLNGCFTGCH